MDHVRLPHYKACEPLEVPNQCLDEYPRGLPFQMYPMFTQWKFEELFVRPQWTRQTPFDDDDRFERRPLEEATSFLQNWIFFGLITSILGPEVPLEEFRHKTKEGTAVITTATLPEFIQALELRDQNLTDDEIESKYSNADQCLLTAHKVLTFVAADTTIDPRIILSLSALGDYLTCVRNSLYGAPQGIERMIYLYWGDVSFSADLLATRMLRDQWCKSQVRRAFRLSPSGRYYISNLSRPDPERKYDQCNEWQCVAYQMHWETYQTAHIEKNCNCPFIHAKPEELSSMLARRKIPVISTETQTEEGTPIELHEAEENKYVAISHVWSDGLGNPWHNALPRCQLRRICNLVRNLGGHSEPSFFWIDTICCPREPMETRRQAIALMGETYNGAEKTLVLDNYMQSIPATTLSDFDRLACVYVCGWLTRMWTLQEGVLSKMIFLQFSDLAVDFTWTIINLINSSSHRAEKHKFTNYMMKLRGPWVLTRSPEPFSSLQSLVEAIFDRSTSVATDEAICLGNMTGTDMDRLVEAPPQMRMKRFWEIQKSYSGDLIFWTGLRLKEKGYRWAPASFMNQHLASLPGNIHSNETKLAFRTTSGLKVRFPGVVLGPLKGHRAAQKFWLRDASREWTFWMECTRSTNPDNDVDNYEGIPSTASTADLQEIKLALIFREIPGCLEKETSDFSYTDCALCSVERWEGEIVYVKLETTGKLYRALPGLMVKDSLADALDVRREILAELRQQQHADISERDSMNGVILQDKHFVFDGSWLGEGQEWCVE